MEKYDFIKLMLKSRNLSVNDKKRLVLLATREIEKQDKVVPESNEGTTISLKEEKTDPSKQKSSHFPKDTATFLSLFNNPNGLKFLTHDFDPNSDMTYEKLMQQAQDNLKTATHLPPSLYALISTFLTGGKDGKGKWRDSNNKEHSQNFSTDSWAELAKKNPGMHLRTLSAEINKEIEDFRRTIRIVKPSLKDISNELAKKFQDLNIETQNLENADFYTNALRLKNGLERILRDMTQYAKNTPNVKIEFQRKYDDDYNLRIITITQIDSNAGGIEDVLKKFKTGGGAFNEIQNQFIGYCNWSVEALWENVPLRWNILDDTNRPETEYINSADIKGFTHILTFYSK